MHVCLPRGVNDQSECVLYLHGVNDQSECVLYRVCSFTLQDFQINRLTDMISNFLSFSNNIRPGCARTDVCQNNRCKHGACVDQWWDYRCQCKTGYDGSLCDKQAVATFSADDNNGLVFQASSAIASLSFEFSAAHDGVLVFTEKGVSIDDSPKLFKVCVLYIHHYNLTNHLPCVSAVDTRLFRSVLEQRSTNCWILRGLFYPDLQEARTKTRRRCLAPSPSQRHFRSRDNQRGFSENNPAASRHDNTLFSR